MPDPTENGRTEGDFPLSIEERAALEAEHEPSQEELFPSGFMDGDPWTLSRIHKGNKPVDVTAALSSAEVPLRGGIPAPDKVHRLLIRTGHLKYEIVPVYEKGGEQEDIEEYKIRVKLRIAYVEPVASDEQLVRDAFRRIIIEDPQFAAQLADELSKHAALA
jgi:hypothetical protein